MFKLKARAPHQPENQREDKYTGGMSKFGHGVAIALFFALLIAVAVGCFYAAGVLAEVVY